jgi:Tol biopolymer transport system component
MCVPLLDVWIANAEDLGTGTSVDQYCEQMIKFYERRARVDKEEPIHGIQLENFRLYNQARQQQLLDEDLYLHSPWSNPTNYGIASHFWEPVSPRSEGDFCLSPDGLELYFGFADPNGPKGYNIYDIWVTRRASTDGQWNNPRPLGPNINSKMSDGAPWLSSDGLSLYFASRRPGGYGRMDLWVSTRPTLSDSWSKVVNLGPAINTPGDEYHPSLTEDGLTMYFSGFWFPRKGSIGQSDIWVTKRRSLSDPWEVPTNLGANINSGYLDRDPFIAADGSFLLFCSRRPGGYNDDIWIAERTAINSSFGRPIPISSPVNDFGDDGCPFLSSDQSTLYFLSSRDDGNYRIWQVPILRKEQGIPIGHTMQKVMEKTD